MSAIHAQNFHHPLNHNERTHTLIRKFNVKLDRAKGERQEILDKEKAGERLCFADEARCSSLFFEISDLTSTIVQLESLILPEDL